MQLKINGNDIRQTLILKNSFLQKHFWRTQDAHTFTPGKFHVLYLNFNKSSIYCYHGDNRLLLRHLLRLCVTQKALQWPFFFPCLDLTKKALQSPFFLSIFSFFFLPLFLDGLPKFFWFYFIICYTRWCDRDRTAFIGHCGKYFHQGCFYCLWPPHISSCWRTIVVPTR